MMWTKVSKCVNLCLPYDLTEGILSIPFEFERKQKITNTHRKQHANLNKTDKHIFTLKENKKHKHTPSIKKTTTEIKQKLII